jgi:hypothetical protein
MSFWDTAGNVAGGFAVGGPIGAAIGGVGLNDLSNFFGVGSGDPGNPYRNALQSNAQALGVNAQDLGSWCGQMGQAYNQNQTGINNTIGMLQGLANGQNSVSQEQARQNMQQAQRQQMSMAQAAAPQNAAMAARNAAMNTGNMATQAMGQQALAGLQERQQAMGQLGNMQMGQAQMNQQGALGAYNAASNAYGQANQALGTNLQNPQKSWWDKVIAPMASGGAQGAGQALAGMV